MYFPETRSRALISRRFARKAVSVAAGVAVAGVVSALFNRWLAKEAERRNPPIGRFITVNGVRLHYVDQGTGTPLVLLHGNGSMIEDFQSSGLLELAAKKYRVIALDRPGFGHSDRPRRTVWTPQAQANLIAAALKEIGVSKPIVLGHSWGALVAVALALKYPPEVQALILASGYYYPNARADVVILSPPAIPLIGDLLSHTISPLLSRLMWPLILRKIFGPSPVPSKFEGFPEEMAVRPSQLRAAAAESALMIPAARGFRNAYQRLKMPVNIVTGAADRFIESDQSTKLHREIPGSTLRSIPGAGHMVHQTATAEILSAIDAAANQRSRAATKGVA
jgi:pimeloyl-ACP methyl ester carboxylesterase